MVRPRLNQAANSCALELACSALETCAVKTWFSALTLIDLINSEVDIPATFSNSCFKMSVVADSTCTVTVICSMSEQSALTC